MNQTSRGPRPEVSRRALLKGSLAAAATLAAGGLLGGCRDRGPTGEPAAEGPTRPVRGGRLRAAISGASTTDETLDPHLGASWADGARAKNIFDKLAAYNADLTVTNRLAETIEPNRDGSVWRIRLRAGVTWHDGKPLTADDVLYSVRRMLDPANALPAATDLAPVDAAGSRKVDDLTVELAMRQPIADLPSLLAGWYVYVVQDGAKDFSRPVGTGPFKLASFSPGDRCLLVRNENYWEDGKPYLDEVELITINDAEARLNAFLGSATDVSHELAPSQAKAQAGNPGLRVVASPIGIFHSFIMRVDQAPFDDNRVREALKYAVDRQQLVDTVFFGYGEVGNDLYGQGAPYYHDQLPQRAYDPERAKWLLREAGRSGLEVTLHTSDPTPGMLEAATLFAEQAKGSGLRVKLRTSPRDSYWSDVYLKVPFAQTNWGSYALDWFYAQTVLSDSRSNETGWRRPDFDRRFAEARATMDPALKRERYFALQEELHREGGYVIHSFAKWLDGLSPRVRGVEGTTVASNDWCSYRGAWLAG
ncbi:MAG: ABC transporter substrate-binding protein [Acidimicrobiia bacterium]